MKQSEFKRWLASLGATFKEGAGHTKVFINDKQTTIPRHGSSEIDNNFVKRICKQLGLNKHPF